MSAALVAAAMGAPQAASGLATVGLIDNLIGKGEPKGNRYRLAKKSNT